MFVLESLLDRPATKSPAIREMLSSFGHEEPLLDILGPIYAVANAGTFFGGALRIRPLVGVDDEQGVTVTDTVTLWNDVQGWKRWHPFFETADVFVFADTALGDLLGVVPGDTRVVVVRTSAYAIETLDVAWPDLFASLATDPRLGETALDLDFTRDAMNALGSPAIDDVLSWRVPPRLGGARSVENLETTPLALHVDFQLQLLHQALIVHRLPPGTPLPPVDLEETAEGEMRVRLRCFSSPSQR